MYILYLVQFSDDCMNMDDIYAWPPLKKLINEENCLL